MLNLVYVLCRLSGQIVQSLWVKTASFTHVVKTGLVVWVRKPFMHKFSGVFEQTFPYRISGFLGVVWPFPQFPHNSLTSLIK